MKEIVPGLFLGNDGDTDAAFALHYVVVSVAKEPWHRRLAGYTGRAAPEGPERFAVQRGRHLALNWVDVDNPDWFRPEELALAGRFIDAAQLLQIGCLVHCNQGVSRSPALVLWWLKTRVDEWRGLPFEAAEEKLRAVYPEYDPTEGLREFVRRNW